MLLAIIFNVRFIGWFPFHTTGKNAVHEFWLISQASEKYQLALLEVFITRVPDPFQFQQKKASR